MSETFRFKRKNATFPVAADRSKMISLQDSDGCAGRFVSPTASRLAVSPAVGHIN